MPTSTDRRILRWLTEQPATVREAVIERIDPAYRTSLTRVLFPSRGVVKSETGYVFATGADDLHAIRQRIGACKTCGGFLELRHDEMKRAVATCVPCGRHAEVPE